MLKVLIVDDEEIICDLISTLFDWEYYQMQVIGCVYDGEEAYEQICEKNPDVVITDIRMPGMDGLEMLRKVQQKNMDCKFIILSGYKDFSYAQEALKLGASDYFLKPVEEEDLLRTLLKIQEEKKTVKQQIEYQEYLNQELESSRHKLLTQFLKEELDSASGLTYQEVNQQYGTEFKPGFFCVLKLVWDHSYGKTHVGENAYELLKSGEIIRDILNKEQCCYLVEKGDQIHIILNTDKKDIKKELEVAFENASAYICFAESGKLTVGVSGFGEKLEELGELAKQARKACYCRLNKGCGKILYYGEQKFADYSAEELMCNKNENELKHLVEVMEWQQVSAMALGLFSKIPEDADPDIYYQLHRWILNILSQAMLYAGMELEATDNYVRYCHNEIQCCASTNQIIYETKKQIGKLIDKAINQQNMAENRLVNTAKKYIWEHYGCELYLADVAEKVHLSPSYFSSIFKRETGMNFNDYLIECRIDAAKELLKTAECSVAEAGERVGYNDSKYFSKLFHKVVGITPRDYRKLFLKGKL